jgi:hypothetical protein
MKKDEEKKEAPKEKEIKPTPKESLKRRKPQRNKEVR